MNQVSILPNVSVPADTELSAFLRQPCLAQGSDVHGASCLLVGARSGELETGEGSGASPLENSMVQPALGRSKFLAEHLCCLNQLICLSPLPTTSLAFRRSLIFMRKFKIAQKADSPLPAPQAIFFLGPSTVPGWQLGQCSPVCRPACPSHPHPALGPHWLPGPAMGLHKGPTPRGRNKRPSLLTIPATQDTAARR